MAVHCCIIRESTGKSKRIELRVHVFNKLHVSDDLFLCVEATFVMYCKRVSQ